MNKSSTSSPKLASATPLAFVSPIPSKGTDNMRNHNEGDVDELSLPRYDLVMDILKERPCTPSTIAASGYDSDGDHSSLSSLSFEDAELHRRSIFGSYWKQNESLESSSPASRPGMRKRSMPPPQIPIENEYETNDDSQTENNTYERTLKEQEDPPKSRRSIFGTDIQALTKQRSMPCFRINPPLAIRRKAVSDSTLQCKRLPSCMRPARFSGCNLQESVSQPRKVSFDGRIHIVDYDLPVEVWAEDGWSKHFAI
jgi:hypothetical protein